MCIFGSMVWWLDGSGLVTKEIAILHSVCVGSSARCFLFLPQSKDMKVSLIGDSELALMNCLNLQSTIINYVIFTKYPSLMELEKCK